MKPSDIIKRGIQRRVLEIKRDFEDQFNATFPITDNAALSAALLEIALSRIINAVGSEDTIVIVEQVISKLQAEQALITRLTDANATFDSGGDK